MVEVIQSMSRHKSFCSKCMAWTMHTYEYERILDQPGFMLIVTATCEKCGHKVEEVKQ